MPKKDAGKLMNTNESQISTSSPNEPKVKTLRDFSIGKCHPIQAREHTGSRVNNECRSLEKEVLTHISDGMYPKEIARKMHISYSKARRIIARLEGKEAVRKVSRSVSLLMELTDYGRALLENKEKMALLHVEADFSRLEDVISRHFVFPCEN